MFCEQVIKVARLFFQNATQRHEETLVMFKDVADSILQAARHLRIRVLVHKGLRIGRNVHIGGNVTIDLPYCHLISIGDDCILSQSVIILAHDASAGSFINIPSKTGYVAIGNKSFIGAGAIILPSVRIGKNVIIGAGSVVTHDIPDNTVAAGNPARVIETLAAFLEKRKEQASIQSHAQDS